MSALAIAHKKLKGDLNNSYQYNSSETTLYWDEWDKTYTTYYGRMSRETLIYIATVEEFNNFKGDNVEVYTQEMADNGVLPSVGMECLVLNHSSAAPNYNKATIKYMGDLVVYAYCKEGERCDSKHKLKFKPLTPLEDGKAYKFENYKREWAGIYCNEESVFHTHQGIHKSINCTNIQPLTVETKS